MPHIQILSDLAQLSRVASFVAEFSREESLGPAVSYRLDLILEELVTNTIEHGYDGDEGRIDIELNSDGETVCLEIRDRAPGYDPLQASAPDPDTPLDERRPGGLGIHLVRELAQDFAYERRDGENRLTLRLSLSPGPASRS